VTHYDYLQQTEISNEIDLHERTGRPDLKGQLMDPDLEGRGHFSPTTHSLPLELLVKGMVSLFLLLTFLTHFDDSVTTRVVDPLESSKEETKDPVLVGREVASEATMMATETVEGNLCMIVTLGLIGQESNRLTNEMALDHTTGVTSTTTWLVRRGTLQ